MICLACAEPCAGELCRRCRGSLAPAPDRIVDGILVRSAHVHEGAARVLVHRLKYGALAAAAVPLARAMAPLVPDSARRLVPIPRVVARRWRHGVDPAAEIARVLGRLTGIEVAPVLRPAMWVPRRAGGPGARRGVPRFRLDRRVGPGAVLVDDVVTTGTTLRAAARASRSHHAVTATSAGSGRGAVRP